MLSLLMTLCLMMPLLSVAAPGSNSSHAQPKETCKLRSYWITHVKSTEYNPTNDCRGLNEILQIVNRNDAFDFCKADPDTVMKYINSSLSVLKPQNQPRPCEVHQWYYGNYGGKFKQPFCQNATNIAVEVNRSHKKDAAQTQPYMNVIHRARGLCHEKLKIDLQSIGDPDIGGIGVRFPTRRVYNSIFHSKITLPGVGFTGHRTFTIAVLPVSSTVAKTSVCHHSAEDDSLLLRNCDTPRFFHYYCFPRNILETSFSIESALRQFWLQQLLCQHESCTGTIAIYNASCCSGYDVIGGSKWTE